MLTLCRAQGPEPWAIMTNNADTIPYFWRTSSLDVADRWNLESFITVMRVKEQLVWIHEGQEDLGRGVHACVISSFIRVRLCATLWTVPSGSSGHGILQARILEWVVLPASRESSQPRD